MPKTKSFLAIRILVISIRTMPAAAFATISPFKVILLGEYPVALRG